MRFLKLDILAVYSRLVDSPLLVFQNVFDATTGLLTWFDIL